MNYGPVIFLAAFFALSASWFGLVLTPQIQIGRQSEATNAVDTAQLYPKARSGTAHQGLEVYRANHCAACHSQQIGQTGIAVDVVLSETGTNLEAVASVLKTIDPTATAAGLAGGLPKTVLHGGSMIAAEALLKAFKDAGAKAQTQLVPLGPDIERGWGSRRTVAVDYLGDYPVMLGALRIGPDLANVSTRLPDANWHLAHLYAPKSVVEGSPMPSYRYLFQTRKVQGQPSPDALKLKKEFAPAEGYEVVPTPEAKQLVAYLLSLHADTPLFEAPMSAPVAAKTTAAK
ncbi:MAG: cbb3-type cytochrome c oxidase subunit II [Verrucomicrobiota bacterium]